jgi:IS605 OrfB family transposase
MKITKTAKLKITSHTNIFKETLSIYNRALNFYIKVCEKEYHELLGKSSKDKLNYIESITHATAKNKNIKYDFNEDFYKYPSYLRRATIMDAIGVCDSHFSRLALYNEELKNANEKKQKFFKKPPKLNYEPREFPVFYKSNMWDKIEDGKGRIKLYKNNDWVWIDIDYKAKDLLSGKTFRFSNFKEQNPKLVKKGKKYFLHIPYQTEVKLNSTPLKQQKVIGVDLGLTNSAVCSCIDYNGTVIDRLFINQSIEKDHLKKIVNKLAQAKRESGIINEKPNYWRKINNLQKFIIQNTVDEIIEFALKHKADVIVFEYLGKMKLPKNSFGARRLRGKLQYWAKCKIQEKTFQKAHSLGIRYSKVLARGTSMYAYDGSGKVQRTKRKDIAKFANNKTYHADLSASYNIASRYFIRAIIKPLSEKARLQLEVKVPLIVDRTNHTLSSLIKIHEVINYVNYAKVSHIHDKEASPIAS